MSIDLAQPIVWTSKGNLQESELTYFSRFEFPDSGAIVHVFGYIQKSTGEVVKQSVDVCVRGLEALLETGSFGKGESS